MSNCEITISKHSNGAQASRYHFTVREWGLYADESVGAPSGNCNSVTSAVLEAIRIAQSHGYAGARVAYLADHGVGEIDVDISSGTCSADSAKSLADTIVERRRQFMAERTTA